jgi:hypothetical protein
MSYTRYSVIGKGQETKNSEYEDYNSALKHYKQLLKSQRFDELCLISLTVETLATWNKV